MEAICPEREQLLAYSSGRADPSDEVCFAQHLEGCQRCQSLLSTLSEDNDWLLTALRQPATVEPFIEEEAFQRGLKVVQQMRQAGVEQPAQNQKPPDSVGQYRIVEILGRGGMSVVYKAEHATLQRPVALKLLPTEWANDPQWKGRFLQEARAAARLEHPHVVRVFDAGELDGHCYLAMELLDGVNLDRLVRRRGALPFNEACEIVRQAALGLQHLHDHGLVHRDVKPSNLMLTSHGEVKVLDLGLARVVTPANGKDALTRVDQVLGTLEFMAPEQCVRSQHADRRADIYSLGCTLVFLLAGSRPGGSGASADTWTDLLDQVASNQNLPQEVVALARRTLQANPEDRPQTATEFALNLSTFSAAGLVSGSGPETIEYVQPLRDTSRDNCASAATTSVARIKEATTSGKVVPTTRSRWLWISLGAAAVVLVAVLLFTSELLVSQGSNQRSEPKLLADLIGHEGEIFAVAFLHNRNEVVSSADDKAIMHWSIDRQRWLAHWRPAKTADRVETAALAVSPDDRLLAAGERDGRVRLWNLTNVTEQRQFGSALKHRSSWKAIRSVAFSSDGQRIVSASEEGSVRVWDTATQTSPLEFSYPGSVYSARFSSDNQRVLLGGKSNTVVVWDLKNDRQQTSFDGHKEQVLSVGWRNDGHALSAGGRLPNKGRADNTIRVWDAATGHQQRSFQVEASPEALYCVAFSADGSRALSGHRNGMLRLWNVDTGQAVAAWKAHDTEVTCATFSRDGKNGRVGRTGSACPGLASAGCKVSSEVRPPWLHIFISKPTKGNRNVASNCCSRPSALHGNLHCNGAARPRRRADRGHAVRDGSKRPGDRH